MPTVNRIIGLSCWKGQVEMNILQIEKQIQIVSALAEGCSIRATARMVGVEHKTVMRVLLRVGEACEELLEDKIRRVRAKRVVSWFSVKWRVAGFG
jgi:IS30 family transposase